MLLDVLLEDEVESIIEVENQTDNKENSTDDETTTDNENAMDYKYVTDNDEGNERMIEY
ncbi:31702_t:CDS:2 [Gigaspora margarita]|uniref:31702_t:CDS:1 n=1 Tax=Gigaspora margarita TaxID=4874 RepID=A0ABN7UEM4_GIGMA|nr:31702_t:CDS:2 [Gigaspora margarita]